MKTCRMCKKTYSEEMFYKDKTRSDGLTNLCRACNTISCKKYRDSHRDAVLKYGREWASKNKESVKRYARGYRLGHPHSWMISSARCRAKKKGIAFDLDKHRKELKKRTDRCVCEVTGMAIDPTKRKAFNSPSLDRIVPELGYTYDNIRVVCYGVNCALGTWGLGPVMEMARMLLKKEEQ